ncbi:hypothetical protein BKG96_08465 [Rodentibacter caecimuris]|uniref:Uncharacterized protein n=1 Tax=Rodentibacter caecimuris TaxID=1796644 RepID=A0A1V3KIP6_9PAST|nr:hypothetical protein [Rodentibacter heylii]OOF77379.1 hypothetical protein BKG96_08465 [Rodentibacter heylii]OOF77529.1 hypothetical protein BKG97_10885 [Rodentibacter heylii]
MQNFTKRQTQWIRRYIKKHNDSTLEIKERSWGKNRCLFTFVFVIFIYMLFFKAGDSNPFVQDIKFSLFPKTTLERSFWEDPNNPGYTRRGESKEQFIDEMYKIHRVDLKNGWIILFVFIGMSLLYIKGIKPRGKFRIDRQRKLIYTYDKNELHITEVEKLSEPLYKYFSFKEDTGLGRALSTSLVFWIQPYGKMSQLFIPKGVININDYSMRIFKNEEILPFIRQVMIEFLDPNTPKERISEILKATECKKDFFNKFIDPILAIFDLGFWRRKKWNEEKIEQKISDYFSHESIKITRLPICKFTPWGNDSSGAFPVAYFVPNKIVTVKELEKQGIPFPCKDLYQSIDNAYMNTPMFNGFLEKLKEKMDKNQVIFTEDINQPFEDLRKLKRESDFVKAKEWLTSMYSDGSLVFLDDNENIDDSPIIPKPISKINIIVDYAIGLATTVGLLWGAWFIVG